MKAKILVTGIENMQLFGGKLPTKRWSFCEIYRKITIESCPHGIYEAGNYGYFMVDGKKIRVVNGDSINPLFEIRI